MMTSKSVLLRNMFNPDEFVCPLSQMLLFLHPVYRETERDWDTDLAEDVKGECETKYGTVLAIKVEKDTEVKMHSHFPRYAI